MTKVSKFANLPGVRIFRERKRRTLQSNGAIPFFLPHHGVSGATIHVGGTELINFSGYNYLGLADHPEVTAAAKRAIDEYGTTVSASRIVSGEIPLHGELEQELAEFLGAEACLVYVSGYNTNVTTIGHLYGHRDLIVHDEQSHNSIINGSILSRAKRHGYEHNDLDAVEALLARERPGAKRALVVAEGVYSMSGDSPDLARLSATCQRHDAELLLDEAHSIGTLGATGRGLSEHFGLDQGAIDIQIGTLSKALSSCGGFVAGDATLIEYLRYSAPGFIFSVGLPPAETAAALGALRVLKREPERVARLQARAQAFRAALAQEGVHAPATTVPSPIVPVVIGDQYLCMRVSKALFDEGIHVQPVVYPAVLADSALLRFFITADHTEEQLRRTARSVALAIEQEAVTEVN